MKRVLKIFGICLGAVIVGMGLLVGAVWLFGGFNEKIIKPENIAFTETEVTTSSAIALRVTTETPKVNQKDIQIDVTPSGIIKCPSTVTLGEDFIVWPEKGPDGFNVGGIVSITASFEGIYTSTCIVKVDVPVSDIVISTGKNSLSLGEQIDFTAEIVPARALNPWKTDLIPDDPKLYDARQKQLYYFLLDKEQNLMDTTQAYFYRNGSRVNMLTSNEINSSTRIVAEKQCEFYVKAFCFSTFAREDYYKATYPEIKDFIYSDRDEIREELIGVLKPSRSETGDEKGQFVNVVNVYINSFTSAEDEINTFLYENLTLVARKPENSGDTTSFNLDLKLHPSESSQGYTYLDLDAYIDNIHLTCVEGGADITIEKQGQFIEGSPADWKWVIVPSKYNPEATTATLRASIDYIDEHGSEQTLTRDFSLKVNERKVASIVANQFEDPTGATQNYVSLNSDHEDTNSIQFEDGFYTTTTDSGLLTYNYKYFNIVAGGGQPYPTFGLLKFFLPGTAVTVPSAKGTYKLTYEFDAKANTDYLLNVDGTKNGTETYYKYNSSQNKWEVAASVGEAGRYRTEVFFTKTTETPATFSVRENGETEIAVSNVLYYEQGSEYPYLYINDVKVKTFFNNDTKVITRQLAEIDAEGYGNFEIIAAVVATDSEGAVIYDEDQFIVISSINVPVRVTNSVKDMTLGITDYELPEGATSNVVEGDFNKTVVIEEDKDYYLHIAPGALTAMDVLTKAVEDGFVNINYEVKSDYLYKDGEVDRKVNYNALTIDAEFIEEKDADLNVVGYMIRLTAGNVFSVEDIHGDAQSITFSLTIDVTGTNFSITKTIEVRDHVINEAKIGYDGSYTVNNKEIYANNISGGVVEWKEWSGSAIVKPDKFNFVFEDKYNTPVSIAADINFVAKGDNGGTLEDVITTGLIYTTFDADDNYVLNINNFPYYDNGVTVDISMGYSGNDDAMTKRYVLNPDTQRYELVSYLSEPAVYKLKIRGFKIEYTQKASTVKGVQGSKIDVTNYATIKIRTAQGSGISKDISEFVSFAMTTTEYFELVGKEINVKKSVTDTQNPMVTLRIGENVLAYHTFTITSPFDVEALGGADIEAPTAAEVDIRPYFSVKKDGVKLADNLVEYGFASDAVLPNGKTVGDYISLNDGKLTAKYVPFDFTVNISITVFEMNGSDRENKGTFTKDLVLNIVNRYATDHEVRVGETYQNNEIYGDQVKNRINISTVYAGNDYIIDVVFENHLLDENDPYTQFVYVTEKDEVSGYSIYAYDIVSETGITVTVTLNITIPNKGDTVIVFDILVKQYVHIDFAQSTALQSGSLGGKNMSIEDTYKVTDAHGENMEGFFANGVEFVFVNIVVAPESANVIELSTSNTDQIVVAKSGITEATTAYVIITRKLYTHGSDFYTINYRLAVRVVPPVE